MVQVGRIHKRIDRCVPGGDRILPESGPEVSDRILPESGPEVSDRILPESGPEVSDRILPESGPEVSDRGSARKKFSFWPKPSPARTQNRLCILKPPCLKVNENLPARARFLFRLFSAKREPFLQKIPF